MIRCIAVYETKRPDTNDMINPIPDDYESKELDPGWRHVHGAFSFDAREVCSISEPLDIRYSLLNFHNGISMVIAGNVDTITDIVEDARDKCITFRDRIEDLLAEEG